MTFCGIYCNFVILWFCHFWHSNQNSWRIPLSFCYSVILSFCHCHFKSVGNYLLSHFPIILCNYLIYIYILWNVFLFFSQNIHVCTVYTNLGDDAVVHALKETEVTTIVTSHELLPRFKQMLSSLPNIRTIVYLEDQLQKVSLGILNSVQFLNFSHCKETKGRSSRDRPFTPGLSRF